MTALEIDIEKENKIILRAYRKLLQSAKHILTSEDIKLVRKAYRISSDAHQGMRRKSGEPYILHPLAVAQITVEEMKLDSKAIIAALLHDTVEDTAITVEEIREQFGEHVATIVEGLTKMEIVTGPGASSQAENFRKMLLTLGEDIRVILVKLADRLHNMRTLDSMPRAKQLKISSETNYIYAPIAHRLGLYEVKSELEDLWLKYTETDKYNDILANIKRTKAERSKFIKNFTSPIKEALFHAGFTFEIKERVKSIYSIWKKMERDKISFEEVYDLFAIRIILQNVPRKDEKAACWTAYSLVTDYYKPNPDRLRDWITTPKSNGYESLHTTVMYRPAKSNHGQWVEVQIRTDRMNDIAEKGLAAHWRYKQDHQDEVTAKTNLGFDDWLLKVREMLEESDTEALDFVNDFRKNLYSEEIYVFTPKGDLRILPKGATALDFAYEIHTEIGSRCIGAKINHKLVPLSQKLSNGDQIDILVSSKQRPGEHWLEWVTTSKATSKIKSSLKEEYKLTAKEGKDILQERLKKINLPDDEQTHNKLRAYTNSRTLTELYYKIGRRVVSQQDLKRFRTTLFNKDNAEGEQKYHDAKSFAQEVKKIRGQESQEDSLLIGDDLEKIDYQLAQCCNPIPGDDVFGFVTVNEGIKIHRTSCPNAMELMSNYGYRIVKARWTKQQELAFLAGLVIKGTDRVGMVNDITHILSGDMRINIRSISVESDDGFFEGTFMLDVQDTAHMEKIIHELSRIEGVEKVSRIS